MKRLYSLAYILLLSILVFNFNQLFADGTKDDYYAQLKRSWIYIQRVYEQLNQHYVEEIAPYPLIKSGINGMLDKLDPYTVLLEEDGDRRLKMITTGKYGGLGMEIGLRNKKVTIISPIDDSPAQRMGVQAGDVIEKVDSQSITGWSIDKVSRHLRGKIGTKVTLLIRRPGLAEPFTLTLTRAEIVIKDVGYAGFINPGVGYVNLNGFTEKAPAEVRQAILDMQKQSAIKSFVLDLRGNPGGLLESAVKIVNLFVPKGRLIVFTKGFREKEYKFFTTDDPILPEAPLVVLVDGGSASASEIVAGALQDLDRALIVGQPTFGKGLVQKVFTIDKHRDIKLKVTTAKYYIPSGRCIQKQDYARNNEVILHDSTQTGPDSVRLFYTLHHRPVHDRGGIYPDVQVKRDSISYVLIQLIKKSMIFDFTVNYHQQHPHWQADSASVDALMAAFYKYLEQKKFDYTPEYSSELKRLKDTLDKKKYSPRVDKLFDELEQTLAGEKARELTRNEAQIKKYLTLDLLEKYRGKAERVHFALKRDPQALKAIELLHDTKTYRRLLAGK